MHVIKANYSYHEKSAPPPLPPSTSSAVNGDGDVASEGGALSAVGNALGGVAGAVRSGFGIGRLLGRGGRKYSDGEIADAVGGDGVGLSGEVVAAAVGTDDNVAGKKSGAGGVSSVVGDVSEPEKGAAVAPGAGAAAAAVGADAERSKTPAKSDDGKRDTGDAVSPKRGSTSTSAGSGEGAAGDDEVPSSSRAGGGGTGARGIGGSNCAAMAEDTAGDTSGSLRPRPTVAKALEADTLVGDAMVTYWASFGKVSSLGAGRICARRGAWSDAVRGFWVDTVLGGDFVRKTLRRFGRCEPAGRLFVTAILCLRSGACDFLA